MTHFIYLVLIHIKIKLVTVQEWPQWIQKMPNLNSSEQKQTSFNREQKQTLERILAACFITQRIGYGYSINYVILKKKNIQITCNCYTNTMTSVIRNVYRTIQGFLKNDEKRRLEPITPLQFRLLRSPLIQAKEWLYKEELATFYKFVRVAYNLVGDTQITLDEARKLYGRIMLTLQKYLKKNNAIVEKKKIRPGDRNIPSQYMSYRIYEASN